MHPAALCLHNVPKLDERTNEVYQNNYDHQNRAEDPTR